MSYPSALPSTFTYSARLLLPKEKHRRVLLLAGFLHGLRTAAATHLQEGGSRFQQEVLARTLWIEKLYSAAPPTDGTELAAVLKELNVPKRLLLEFLDGLGFDLLRRRYRDWEQFQQFAHKAAGIPAQLLGAALGQDAEAQRSPALAALGEGWQLAGSLATVAADLDRGVVYFPQSALAEFGYTEVQLAERRFDPPAPEFFRHVAERALARLTEGAAALDSIPDDGARRWAASWVKVRRQIPEALQDGRNPFAKLSEVSTLRVAKILFTG